jgi:anti-anti-sigma factor
MKISIDNQEIYSLIKIDEEKIDSRNAADLKHQFVMMNGAGVKSFILDLSKTKYVDSSGLSAILVGNRLANNAGGNLVLTGLQSHVLKMLEISQLLSVLYITETNEEAIEALFLAEMEGEEEPESFTDGFEDVYE